MLIDEIEELVGQYGHRCFLRCDDLFLDCIEPVPVDYCGQREDYGHHNAYQK